MNFFEWVVFMGTSILSNLGVDFGPPPVPGPQTEIVQLVLYYSDGDFDWKGVGEMILINSGETLQVKRNRIRPEAKYIVNDWNKGFLPVLQGSPQVGYVQLKLDRENGIVCLQEKCTTLYAICPMDAKLNKGEKCASFARD